MVPDNFITMLVSMCWTGKCLGNWAATPRDTLCHSYHTAGIKPCSSLVFMMQKCHHDFIVLSQTTWLLETSLMFGKATDTHYLRIGWHGCSSWGMCDPTFLWDEKRDHVSIIFWWDDICCLCHNLFFSGGGLFHCCCFCCCCFNLSQEII